MNKNIEIDLVWGCEGNCLVMENYRIAGPKPWGGGRTIQKFHTSEGDLLSAYDFQIVKKLKKQLQIAMEALDDFTDKSEMEDVRERANRAVKDIKKVEKEYSNG